MLSSERIHSITPRLFASSAVNFRLAAAVWALDASFQRILAHPSGEITEYTAFSKISGQLSYEILSDMIMLPEYESLNDEDRVAMVEDAYTYAVVTAKMEVAPGYLPGGNQKWVLKAQEAESNGVPVELYILSKLALSDVEGEKDKDGETIDGSVKKAKMEEINKLPLTREQKDEIFLQSNKQYTKESLKDAPWH